MDEPVKIVVESTPNPKSVRFALNRTVVKEGTEWYGKPDTGEKSPLVKKIFQVPGVKALFLIDSFITLDRREDTEWEDIIPKVEEILREHFT